MRMEYTLTLTGTQGDSGAVTQSLQCGRDPIVTFGGLTAWGQVVMKKIDLGPGGLFREWAGGRGFPYPGLASSRLATRKIAYSPF